ncbi:hypothetical protein [Burkholderia sp. Ac-20365]|uniref:hypothetical protein n=1 Tax=Burkholderia sp. Ac-20365 TaxID=2703897 RepID=UPI00197B9278|nr:hypothetical protein [Burkholderia sp. Ac-20365]MBN3760995.1 hypothetical protein [Burkholderia sp. Ac-20365]
MKQIGIYISPRGIARRLALGRWDYSTAHILELAFVKTVLRAGFSLFRQPESFYEERVWVFERREASGMKALLEIGVAGSDLRASCYALPPGEVDGTVVAKELLVPDDSLSTNRLNGATRASLLLEQLANLEIFCTASPGSAPRVSSTVVQ